MEHDKDRKSKPAGTWAEVFTALDAEAVCDGFVVERDMRAAEEGPAVDAFFAVEREPTPKN